MVPFPESETMTLKRLEVALRKSDWQLLKDGAYKLHEKFHSGHSFEYLSDLRKILYHIESQPTIPPEIVDILSATIKEIITKFSKDDMLPPDFTKDALKAPKNTFSPKELDVLYTEGSEIPSVSANIEAVQKMSAQSAQSVVSPVQQTHLFQGRVTLKDETAIFYDDPDTKIDFSEVKEYRNNLNYLFSKNPKMTDFEILRVIAWLCGNLNTPIEGIDEVLALMSNIEGKASLITTSQSDNLVKALVANKIDFMIPFVKSAKEPENCYDLIPMLGLTNIFVCSSCNNRILAPDVSNKTLSVQCPHCSSSAFPDLYAVNSYNPDCNPIYWHRAFARLVRSKVWIVINPPLDEDKEIIFDFLKTAYMAASPQRVYIHSKDSDKREFYKRTFVNIDPNCDIKAHYASQSQLCDEFMNIEVAQRILI